MQLVWISLEYAMEIEFGRDVLNQTWSICESMFEDVLYGSLTAQSWLWCLFLSLCSWNVRLHMGIFFGILSVSQNSVMDLNNDMMNN